MEQERKFRKATLAKTSSSSTGGLSLEFFLGSARLAWGRCLRFPYFVTSYIHSMQNPRAHGLQLAPWISFRVYRRPC